MVGGGGGGWMEKNELHIVMSVSALDLKVT